MDKKEESLNRLKERIEKIANTEKRDSEIREKEHHQEELRRKKAQEYRCKWYKKYEAKSKIAANIIWKWHKEFIVSSVFQEIVSCLSKTHLSELRISHNVTCQTPSGWDGEWKKNQFFTLDIKKKELFIHNLEKYGKSHRIDEVEDFLEFVEPPILIAVAKTITDGTIWDIINIP